MNLTVGQFMKSEERRPISVIFVRILKTDRQMMPMGEREKTRFSRCKWVRSSDEFLIQISMPVLPFLILQSVMAIRERFTGKSSKYISMLRMVKSLTAAKFLMILRASVSFMPCSLRMAVEPTYFR